ncbi:MAG TPA: hypothetical protein VN685_12230 [Rhizomicrobium sp.]|jgi:hypothetical protein|nr:hypothetical protein [Rhizomicrobium sp.]
MRISGLILCAAASMLATAAVAQSMGGSMSNSKSGTTNSMSMQTNAQGGVGIFSKQDMAMMIVDRDKATMGMTDEQKAAARKEEMAKDGAETPDQRMARKQRYDAEWAKLTPVEQSTALDKLDAQMKARAAAMSAGPAK